MKVLDVVCRMPAETLVTIEDYRKEEILVDRATCDRICAFDETDEKIRKILHNGNVYKMEIGKVYGDLILSIAE